MATAPPNAPPGSRPIGLEGAKLGIAANVFLLGNTEHPDAVAPVLAVARLNEGADRDAVVEAFRAADPEDYVTDIYAPLEPR